MIEENQTGRLLQEHWPSCS